MASGDVVANVGTVIEVAKAGLGLFQEWPLNVMIIAGILGISIGIVRGFIPKRKY